MYIYTGIRMRKEIEDKIDKLHEAPKARIKKALPVPEEKSKKKRGGKKVAIVVILLYLHIA